MIKWDKDTSRRSNSAADRIREMESAVDDLCERLSKDSKDFSPEMFFEILHGYIVKDYRLLYTNITNYIFSLEKEEVFGIMQTNLDKVIDHIYSEQFDEDHAKGQGDRYPQGSYDKTKHTVLKIWDHMNLAKRQYALFKMKDEGYATIVDEKMSAAELRLSKELNGQLISLVSIFTALSFLLFGGISSLDNIFAGAKDIPIIKLMIVGTIWCFCIMNLIFVFMFFVAKMTGLDIRSSQDVNANLVQKYPLIWWCDHILVSVLLLSCWVYYIKNEGFSVQIYDRLNRYPTLYFAVGTIVMIGMIVWGAIKIFSLSKTREKDG